MENDQILSRTFYDSLSVENKIKAVRVGYLGLCARASEGPWVCHRDPTALIPIITSQNQTDPLNLIWLGNRIREEALSLVTVYNYSPQIRRHSADNDRSVFFASTSLSLVLGLIITKPEHLALQCITIFSMLLSIFLAFNVALWQHLASSVSTSMIKSLAFGAITCKVGTAATALAWGSAVLVMSNALRLAFRESGRFGRSSEGSSSTLVLERVPVVDGHGPPEDDDFDIEEPQRQPSWQQTHMPNFAFLQLMTYLSGVVDRDTTARQHSTTAWVNQTQQMRPGFAETIVDTEVQR